MALQARLPFIPAGAQLISPELAMHTADGRVVFFHAGGPIFSYPEGNPEGARLAAAVLLNPDVALAPAAALASALGMSRSTAFECRKRFSVAGSAGLRPGKRGPKVPHKMNAAVLVQAQVLVHRGFSNRGIAKELGVSEGSIRLALKGGALRRPEQPELLSRPRERDEQDRAGAQGVAVKRHEDRMLAQVGKLCEAAPVFVPAESVAKAGVLLALPVVLAQGLLTAGTEVYGRLRNGYFGLKTVLVTLALMSLLRIRTINQLPAHAPGEFGLVLGLDRAPEVKTLRRKLAELRERGLASEFSAALARHWAAAEPDLLGFLYIDGHVRPYNGKKHPLPKTHVPRRRLCMPATTDYWVNDAFADPLFFVTAKGTEGLLAVLEGQVLPEVRQIAGEVRRVTLIMDRECWSPTQFKSWHEQGFDVLTYRKGSYEPWPADAFHSHAREGRAPRPRHYRLAERPLELSNGFEVREVRCLTDDGHQTAIVSTRRDLPILEVAERMFSRWRQENYFRYMRHEFALDHLSTYDAEAADPSRLVTNPVRKEKQTELATLRKSLLNQKQAYGTLALELSADALAQDPRALTSRAEMASIEKHIETLRSSIRDLPRHVPAADVLAPAQIVRLEQEQKRIMDTIKVVGYRAETELAALAGPLLGTFHDDEARQFVRHVFQLPADLVPNPAAGTLTVRFHSLANPRSNRALAQLCTLVNSYEAFYPGTTLRLQFHTDLSEN